MKDYKCYIFDWDGTLANTLEVWFQAYVKLFRQYGVDLSYKDIAENAYGDQFGCIKFGIKDFEKFNNQLFESVKDKYFKAKLYPHVKKVIKTLHKQNGNKVCIFTSTQKERVTKALEYHELKTNVDFILGREDVSNLKPNPEGIDLIMNKYKYANHEFVIIGDSDKDILAGEQAKINSILFIPKENRKYYPDEIYSTLKPTYKISQLLELL